MHVVSFILYLHVRVLMQVCSYMCFMLLGLSCLVLFLELCSKKIILYFKMSHVLWSSYISKMRRQRKALKLNKFKCGCWLFTGLCVGPLGFRFKCDDTSWLSEPIETAVSWESPVIILTATPELMSVPTASLTPALGGSMIPTIPRKVRFPISEPDANARTAGREEHDVSALTSWCKSSCSTLFAYLWGRRCPCSWSAVGRAPSAGGLVTVCCLCCCRSCTYESLAHRLPSWSKLQVCPVGDHSDFRS